MAGSPSKEMEEGLNSPDNEMEGENTTGFDFEVKEQDRWLPIANGKSTLSHERMDGIRARSYAGLTARIGLLSQRPQIRWLTAQLRE